MVETNQAKENLIKGLIRKNLVKFGEFTLKSGQLSNYYIDLRECTHHLDISDMILELVKELLLTDIKIDKEQQPVGIVGVPYGVVPLAGYIALTCRIPYYPIRKEVKGYGNKADFTAPDNMKFIIIEDVMSSGSSIMETIKKMPADKITDVIVMVDRELGGSESLSKEFPHIKLHSIVKASEIMGFYKELEQQQQQPNRSV